MCLADIEIYICVCARFDRVLRGQREAVKVECVCGTSEGNVAGQCQTSQLTT